MAHRINLSKVIFWSNIWWLFDNIRGTEAHIALLAQQHLLFGLHQAVANVGQVAALHADGVHLGYIVGNGAEGGHGSEGHPLKVHVKASHDNAHTLVGQRVTYLYDVVVEKLSLVNAHHVDVGSLFQDGYGFFYRCRLYAVAVVAHHVLHVIACVDGGFEDHHFLMGKHGALHTAYEFFGFA